MLRRLLFRNFRIVYRLSHWFRHRFTPTGMLLLSGMIGAATFGVNTHQSLAYQLVAITASLLLVACLGLLGPWGRYRIRRLLPEYASAGQPLRYRILLENLSHRRQRDLLVFDELESVFPDFNEFINSRDPDERRRNWFDRVVGYPRLMALIQKRRGAAIEPALLEELPGNTESGVEITMTPNRRGYLHFAGSILARPDPFGLLRAIKTTGNRDTLLVLPKLYRAPRLQLHGRRKYQTGGKHLAGSVGDSQEFKSLRDYRPGDPIRSIHWRSYARKSQPVVKEFQDEFFVRKGVVLDSFKQKNSDTVFEEAVSVTASLVLASREQDSLLDLMFVGTQAYRVTTGRSLSRPENLLEILACVEPAPADAFTQLTELVLQHCAETSSLICVLLAWDEQRREFISRILALAIPVLVLVITDREGEAFDPGPMSVRPDHFIVLNTENIQQGLDQITVSKSM